MFLGDRFGGSLGHRAKSLEDIDEFLGSYFGDRVDKSCKVLVGSWPISEAIVAPLPR